MQMRTLIRHYITQMLIDEVDVGGRVFFDRAESPFFLEQAPAVSFSFNSENNLVKVGSELFAKELQCDLQVTITIIAEEITDADDEIDVSQKGEDFIDYLGEQVENCFFDDWRLSKRLPANDPTIDSSGLNMGLKLLGGESYRVTTTGDRRLIAQDIRLLIPYQKHTYTNKRLPNFELYKADIIKVNSNNQTTDRVLLSAEGKIK